MKNNFFAHNLKVLRKYYHLSQSDLAKIVGKTYSAVSLWERELREPSDADIQGFCNHFGLYPSDLMYRKLDADVVAEPQELENDIVHLIRLMDHEQIAKVLNYAVEVLAEKDSGLTLGEIFKEDEK